MATLLDGSGTVITDESVDVVTDGTAPAVIPVTILDDIDPFIERVQIDIPSAPASLVRPFVQRVIREFTLLSWAVYQGIQVEGSGVDASYYKSVSWNMADFFPGLEPIAIKELKDSTTEHTLKQMTLSRVVADTAYKTSGIKYYEIFRVDADGDRTYIRILPFSTDEPTLSMMVAFAVLPEQTTVPAILIETWLETICSGVLAILFRIPLKPWTDLSLSAAHHGLYKQGINRAKAEWFVRNCPNQITTRGFAS